MRNSTDHLIGHHFGEAYSGLDSDAARLRDSQPDRGGPGLTGQGYTHHLPKR